MRYAWIFLTLLFLGVVMGKADIVSGGEDGHYKAKIQYNTDNIDQQIADIDVRLEALDDIMAALEDEKSEYEDQEDAARSAVESAQSAWLGEFQQWKSNIKTEATPIFDGVTIPEYLVKDKSSGKITHTIRSAAYEPEPRQITALKDQFPALEEGAPPMDDVINAQAGYHKIQVAIHTIDQEISYKKLEREELEKRKEELQGVLDTLDADEREMWCADLTEDLSGEQQTIEVKGEPTQILLTPGWRNPQNGNPHWSLDAGKLMPIMGMSAAQAAFNFMILPGWQKFKPMYRVGTITAIDYDNDTATVELDEALSVAQDLDVNQSATLEDVPIKYMECNSGAFVTNDRVVVEFTGQDWASPQVIGFETEPQPCDKIFYYCQQWRRVDNSIVDPRNLPNGGVKTLVIEAESEEEEDIEWEYVDPDGGGSWPNEPYFEIRKEIYPVGAEWNEGKSVDSWGGVLLFDSTDISDFIAIELQQNGLWDAWTDHAGTDYVLAYNRSDDQIYAFMKTSTLDASYESIAETANIQNYLYFVPHDNTLYPDNEYGGPPDFESYINFAPTVGTEERHNTRWYQYTFEGEQGNPSQDPELMALDAGEIGEPPEAQYISYMPDMPQNTSDPHIYAEDLDLIVDGDGATSVVWSVHTESQLMARYQISTNGAQWYLHSEPLGSEHLGEYGTWFPDDPEVDGHAISFNMTVAAEGETLLDRNSVDGYVDLTDDETIQHDELQSSADLTLSLDATFTRLESGDQPTLYATMIDYGDYWWCKVDNIDCYNGDDRGGLHRLRITGYRVNGGQIYTTF